MRRNGRYLKEERNSTNGEYYQTINAINFYFHESFQVDTTCDFSQCMATGYYLDDGCYKAEQYDRQKETKMKY